MARDHRDEMQGREFSPQNQNSMSQQTPRREMDRFQSLSLHDTSQDDYMDIDGYGYVPEYNTSTEQGSEMDGYSDDIRRGLGGTSTPLKYDSDTDDDDMGLAHSNEQDLTGLDDSDHESTSFLAGILSPTELGARLAVGKQLLLPAPGDEVDSNAAEDHSGPHNDSVDYEFDTADTADTNRALTTAPSKHLSVFQDNVERLFFKQDAPPSNLQSLGSQAPSASTQGNNYHLNGVQVHHHHHYYFNPFESSQARQRRSVSAVSKTLSVKEIVKKQSNREVSGQLTHQKKNNNPISRHHDIIMPHPWDRRSSPQVRTVYVLSLYLQLLVNFVAFAFAAYIVYSVVSTIKHDIDEKLQQEASHRLIEMAACRRAYHENQCAPDTIVPAMEQACAHWQKCMNQDPFNGGGKISLVSAHILGMIINSLIEPLGFKVLVVAMSFTVVVFGCNFGFGYLRAKAYWGNRNMKPREEQR